MKRQMENYDMSWLLASASKYSGDWLRAISVSSCGLRLDDEAIRIAVGFASRHLRTPFLCCGAMVDVRGPHDLSCKRSFGRLMRHNHLNDIIRRFLSRASISATKEPSGLMRNNGKSPDGLILTPWRDSRCLIWDAKIADTTAALYLSSMAMSAGSTAKSAAAR